MVQPVLVAALVVLDVAVPTARPTAVEKPDAVTIRCIHGMYDEVDEVRFRRLDAGYVDQLNRPVSTTEVQELSKQLTLPPLPSLDLEAGGISVKGVQQRAEELIAARKLPPSKRRELRARVQDLESIERVVAGRFRRQHGRVDDGVKCSVVVRFGSREVTAATEFDTTLALPWMVDGRATWNARISDLVARLFPDLCRPLLSIKAFVDRVAADVVSKADAGTLQPP